MISSIDHNFLRSSDIPIESREVKPKPYFMDLSDAQCRCLFSSLLFYYSPRGLIRRHLTIDIQQSLHYNFLANRRLRVTFSFLDIIFIIVLFVCQQATIVFHLRSTGFKLSQLRLNEYEAEWRDRGGDKDQTMDLIFFNFVPGIGSS